MPARRGDSQFEYPEIAEYHLRCNPGYDFVRFLGWLEEAPPAEFNKVFAAYARNPIGVILASCAIEGYIHYVGHHIDPDWNGFVKQRNTVRERIERLYSLLKKPVAFSSGVMQDVIQLFRTRRLLVHPRFQETREQRASPPPDIFDHVDHDFPVCTCRSIAEKFRDQLLADAELDNLWWRQGYVEKAKRDRFDKVSSPDDEPHPDAAG
jgi:hypothetical protein